MPKMLQSQQFQDSPLGKVPSDWDVVTVESVGADKPHAIVDGPFGSNLKSEHYRESGIPVIQSGFVTSGEFVAESYVYVDKALFNAQKRSAVEAGDIVMAKIGAQCGTSAILPKGHPVGILAGNSLKISANQQKCYTDYLLRVLHYYYETGLVDLIKTETAQPAISLKNLRQMKIPLPQLPDQHRIAEILDTIDSTIAHTSTLTAKLKQMKAGLLHDLLTRGLDENGKLRDAIAHPEQFKDSPLGLVPKDWDVCPFGKKVLLQRGFDITSRELRPGKIPIVSSSGITGYHDTAMVSGPGVITGRKGSLGSVFYIEESYWPHDTALWVKDFYGNNPKFVFRFIQNMHLERLDSATACPTLNRNYVHPIPVAFPPIEEQQKIIEAIEIHESRIAAEKIYLSKLKEQKTGLMHDLLTGRVRVTDLKEIPA